MAEAFKSVQASLGTTADTSIYQCPASTEAIVILCQVSNVDGTNAADLYVDYYDSSATAASALAHTISIPADSSFNPIGGKLALEAGDQLRSWAGATGDLEIVLSILEIT